MRCRGGFVLQMVREHKVELERYGSALWAHLEEIQASLELVMVANCQNLLTWVGLGKLFA